MPKFAMALVFGAATLAAQTAATGPYGMQFVQIPSGEFSMGCSPGDSECAASESPAHLVRITKAFQIGRHEVTQEQWEAVMGSNPSYSKGAARPVERASWDEVQEFLRRLNARGDGFRYRLPTEAEWEYAARAGSADRYAGAGALQDVAWDYTNSGGETHPVGQKQPNAWGLHDMLGNVYEWCQDWFEETYYAVSPQDDPAGPVSGTYRVIRGGSWILNPSFVRVSSRLRFPPADGYAGIGFRCVRDAAPASTCALACLASGPSSGTTGAAVSFTASAMLASGCSGSPSYSWAFGDGGNSAQQNPSYAYRQSGSYTWTMTASAAGATSCARSGSIQISTGCASPAITAQPAAQTVAAGATAALAVTASGSTPLSYQWYEGASGDTTKPVGTNSATFRAPALATATTYWVRVSNACGQVDSAAATVSVAAFAGPNGIQFMQIQPGEFTMGCSPGDAACYGDESPAHRVRINRGFQIGKYEVTQDQWQAVMGSTPSWFQGATLPVEMVSWDDVQEFLGRLNARNDGFRYRLPTEAEWEYAARAGTTDRYAGAGALGDVAWYSSNLTHPVGQKQPNAWGLHDMLGNVYEWCQDWYGDSYYSSASQADPAGPASGSARVLRGGSWLYIAGLTRVSYRDRSAPGERQGSIGFRCVRESAATSCAGPAIATQPAGQTVAAGSTADLTVTASGSAPLSYQWYEGVKGITSKPVGTNSAAFRTPALTAATTYWVRVTNSCGQVDSAAATVSVTTSAGATIEFVQIQPGEFMMGCSPGDGECDGDEFPVHRVRITRSFQVGKYEVTQQQWQAVMGANQSRSQGAALPVEQVSWDDAQAFLRRMNARNDGFLYRLPTEAEWEYAARAGTTDKYAGAGALGDVAWYDSNSGSQTRPVGQKRPNAWGLYDMLGNVWEWCQDWSGSYSNAAADNPTGPSSGQYRILRGGSWDGSARVARVSLRNGVGPGDRYNDFGFRCVREVAASACAAPAILNQPVGQTIATGSTADLTVTASGSAPLSYQWYEGAKGITTKPVGANSATLRTPALTAAATYWVRVTNACGQADSAAAAVSVATPAGPSGMQFVQIQPGEFTMGCSPDDGECYNDESPAHRVRITRGFQIGKYEVTQEQWQAAMGSNPSRFQDTTLPVEMVSWDDVQEFLRRLNSAGDGYRYRLPTEAEWEYAARAGTTGRYAGAGSLDEVAWYSGFSTRPVGQKQPNAWGIYDMLGNVWEWCQDWYDAATYYPSSQQADPAGPASGTYRILRGGSWVFAAGTARVSYRNRDLPGYRNNNVGFRCVREAIP